MGRLSLNRKPVKFSLICALVLILLSPMFFSLQAVAAQTDDGYYHKAFAWNYDGQHWKWSLNIPETLYDDYKSVPVSTRTQDGPAGYGFCTTTQDAYMQSIAQQLNKTTTDLGYESYDQVSFILAFVQSLPYTSDNVTEGYNEYPRFPVETLVDDGGDCEDTAILFATITLLLGYGTVYINPPNHYAVGILGDNLAGGTYWTYNNRTYYYCETTGNGFKIGELPDDFKGQSAYVYPINENNQYILSSTVTPGPDIDGITTLPTPTLHPFPSSSSNPDLTGPTVQSALPLSFNLITDNPELFIIIVVVVLLCIALAIGSTKRSKRAMPSYEPAPPPAPIPPPLAPQANMEASKFCVYCGSSNKAYAVFCEECGKRIG